MGSVNALRDKRECTTVRRNPPDGEHNSLQKTHLDGKGSPYAF